MITKMFFVPRDKWCVYAHYVDGICIYVGMGRPHRPFGKYARTAHWLELTKDGFFAEILSWHETREEAEKAEIPLIKKLKPTCNLIHTGKARPSLYGNKWNLGRKHTDEAKKVMSEKQKESWKGPKRKAGSVKPRLPIKCIETGIIYDGLREAARQTGFCASHLSNVINGVVPHAGGYHFTREM